DAVNRDNGRKHNVRVIELSNAGWHSQRPITTVEELLPDTETVKSIEIPTPQNAVISVPAARHLYDGHLFGERFLAKGTVEIDGARFNVTTPIQLDVAPAVEIKSFSPSPYVWTPATANRTLSFNVSLANQLAKPFRGTLSISAINRLNGTGQKL